MWKVLQVFFAVGGVDYDEEVVRTLVDDYIVHRPAVFVADRAVTGLSLFLARDVAGDEPLHGLPSRRLGRGRRPSPMCETSKRPAFSRHGFVFGLYAFVLDRHLVAGEVHELRAGCFVLVVERGAAESFSRPPLPLGLELAGGAGFVEAFGRGSGRGRFEFFGGGLGKFQHRPDKVVKGFFGLGLGRFR